jgi:hypothetical protein
VPLDKNEGVVHEISGFSRNFARGIDRRQVIRGLGITATAAFAAAVAPKATAGLAGQMAMAGGGAGFKAAAYNHINYQVTAYAKVRDFYVNLFGMKPVWDDGKQCSVEFGDPPKTLWQTVEKSCSTARYQRSHKVIGGILKGLLQEVCAVVYRNKRPIFGGARLGCGFRGPLRRVPN